MKPIHVALLVLGSVVITAGGIFLGVQFTTETEETEPQAATTTQQQSSGGSLAVSSNDGSNLGQAISPQSQVLGATGNQSSQPSSQPAEVSGPESFGQYEEFADQQNALFGDIEIGEGEEIVAGDTVSVIYSGWLTDGTLFDASRTNEEGAIVPFTFTVGEGQVIRGWEEGIPGMRVGGKRRIVVPAVAGYGERGQGQIPPNAMLVFDVEVVLLEPRAPGL